MEKFVNQLTAVLTQSGYAVNDTYTHSGSISFKIGDVPFSVERFGPYGSDAVKFLDSTFRPSKKDGKYKLDKALGLIVQAIASTLKQRAEEAERKAEAERKWKHTEAMRQHAADAKREGIFVAFDRWDECFNISTETKCPIKMRAILDCIEENGLLTKDVSNECES